MLSINHSKPNRQPTTSKRNMPKGFRPTRNALGRYVNSSVDEKLRLLYDNYRAEEGRVRHLRGQLDNLVGFLSDLVESDEPAIVLDTLRQVLSEPEFIPAEKARDWAGWRAVNDRTTIDRQADELDDLRYRLETAEQSATRNMHAAVAVGGCDVLATMVANPGLEANAHEWAGYIDIDETVARGDEPDTNVELLHQRRVSRKLAALADLGLIAKTTRGRPLYSLRSDRPVGELPAGELKPPSVFSDDEISWDGFTAPSLVSA